MPEGNSLWLFVYNENQKKTSYYRKKEVRERMRHQELIEKMTLEEKAAFLTGKNEWASRGYAHLGIDSITFADGPSGVR